MKKIIFIAAVIFSFFNANLAFSEEKTISIIEEIKQKAQAGDENAEVSLGISYYFGKDIEQDYAQAFKWLETPANKGNVMAQKMLSNMYAKGLGVEKNEEKAFEWAKIIAEKKPKCSKCEKARQKAILENNKLF